MEKNISQPFLMRVAKDVVMRFGKDLREVAIIFNNQRPAYYFKKYLAALQGEVFWSPQFATIQDFFRLSTKQQELNQTAQIFLLNDIHTQIQRETNPAFEESLDHFFPVAEIILSDFAQLDYELADIDKVFQELTDISLLDRQFNVLTDEQQEFLRRFWGAFSPEHNNEIQERFLQLWRILPRLYREFKAALNENNEQTMAGIYRDLAENQSGARDISVDYKHILFVGFNALNACESTIFQRWQNIGKALFYFDADQYYYDDKMMEAGYFIRQNTGNHGLINALGAFPALIDEISADKKIRLIGAPGKVAQAKALGKLLSERNSTESTAILLADESLLIPVLQSIPENIGFDEVNITMGYPMSESFTYSILDLFLEIQLRYAALPVKENPRIEYELLVDYLGHPYSGCTSEDRLSLLEQLTGLKSVVLPVSVIQVLLEGRVPYYECFLTRAGTVPLLMDMLQELLNNIYFNETSVSKGKIELTLMEEAIQSFRQLSQGFSSYPSLSVSLAIKLIRRVMGKLTATLSGDPVSGLQIMGLLESRNLNFDTIYLIGANEGTLPVRQAAPSFIPYNLRKAYGLPVIENQDSLSAYLFYRLLHHFGKIEILYNGVVNNQNTGEITRFAKQLQYESQLPIEEIQVHFLEDKKLCQNHLQHNIPKTGEVWDRLSEFLKETPVDKRRYLSASAFATYLNSPMEFFLKYIAGIKEAPDLQIGIQSNRLGTVIHRVMELAYLPFKQQNKWVTPDRIGDILKNLPALCVQAVKEEFFVKSNSSGNASIEERELTSHERIILKLSEEYCKLFLQYDQQLEGGFLLQELENDIDYLLEFPLVVKGKDNSVILKGIIDRVDLMESKEPGNQTMRIVDYKTGSDILEVKATQKNQDGIYDVDFFNGNWDNSNKAFIQTLFYSYIYEQLSGHYTVEPHLYSIKKIRSGQTNFGFKIPYKGVEPIVGSVLQDVKTKFVVFLKEKLEELFNPDLPFVHSADATVYEQSPYALYLERPIDFAEKEEQTD